jgi:hypothetical protein
MTSLPTVIEAFQSCWRAIGWWRRSSSKTRWAGAAIPLVTGIERG